MHIQRAALVDIHKSYAGREVLRGVTLTVRAGSIHSLVGENGAGKSTLARILAGVARPDRGRIELDGSPVELGSPRTARRNGIALVSQELSLIPKRSVIENVLAGQLPTTGFGLVSRRRMHDRFARLLEMTGVDLPAGRSVGELNQVHQEYVEILRALAGDARVLILDEPTTAMTRDQADKVLDLARCLARSGVAVVLISHALEDVLGVSDIVSVLRDGELVRTCPVGETTHDGLIQDMIGRPLGEQYPTKELAAMDAPVVLSARNIVAGSHVRGVDLDARAGEIVCIAGLVGSGRSEFVRALVGADPRDVGTIEIDGRVARVRNVREAYHLGIVMVPENRKEQGLHLDHSIERNVILPHLRTVRRFGLVQRSEIRSRVTDGIASFRIRAQSIDQPVRDLSGGNQQRVMFAKWLAGRPRVVIADEPTRGVDIAGKRAIYELLADLARNGAAVVIVSSELPEVIGLSHRVLVMRQGRITAKFEGEHITEHNIVSSAFGGARPDEQRRVS